MNDFSNDKAFEGPGLRISFSAIGWSDLRVLFLPATRFSFLKITDP
jgi:hypothetical protein